MAKSKTKKFGVGATIVLVAAVAATIWVVGQKTNWLNHASGPSQEALSNINSASDIISTVNADGTMGPQTSYGNWSNALPSFLKGKLVFAVIDPPQGGKPSDPGNQGQRPTESFREPTHTVPSQAQGGSQTGQENQANDNGPQTVTALNLTIKKVEVHIAYQGKPGDQGQGGKPSVTPSQQGQHVDHWETLTVTNPTIVDLVELAKTHALSKLGITSLAEGKYTEVRLYVSSATATLSNGSIVTLTILGKDGIVRVVKPFTIEAGKTTMLTMDFDAQHSVLKAGNIYILKPVVARLLEEK